MRIKAAFAGAPPGIGLTNMRERAAALGGTLLARDLGCGTEIRARLPLAFTSHP
jgi:signal transduction histidine kinase